MRSLASATQTSSSLASTVDISSSSLTMSENFQNPPLLGTSKSLQLSLPVVSNAASLTGSVCNFSRVSAPAVGAAWLLPSASGTSFQPPMGSAYLYQHASTAMLSGVTGQSQISTSAASNPGMFERALTGSTEKKSSSFRDFTVTVIDQDTAVSSMSMASQYDKTSDANNMVPLYPSLSARLVQGAPSQIANQGHSLSLPYQEGSQVYYYNQDTLGPLLSGERGPYLQSYGSVSYTESRVSAPQPEMVMVLKKVQPTNVIPPASTTGIYYSVPAQPITQTSFQVMDTSLGMETSLGFQPPSQTFCLPQKPEFPTSCSSSNIQILESNPPPELGDTSMAAPVQSPSNFLALPPAPSQKQKDNKNLDNINTMLSKPLDVYQIPTENHDTALLPLEIPDIHQLLAYIDPLGQEDQSGFENADLGKNFLSVKDQGTLENGTESNDGFADIATLVEDIQLPPVLNSLDDLDQSKIPEVIKTKDTRAIKLNEVQKKSSVIKAPSDQGRKNKHTASEPISGAPKAKIKPESPDCIIVGELAVCNAVASDRAPSNTAKHSNSKPQKAAPSRISKTKNHGQEKTKRTNKNNKKAEESKQSGKKVKAEEKPMNPKMKWKKNQPELTQETFKKPRSYLGMHMLESVQVFHALGKKTDKKTEFFSSRALGNSSNPKELRPPIAIKRWLDTSREDKSLEKTQVKRQKPDGSAEKECSSPSEYELPPPGKVKLVPLVFPTLDKPQARPVPRRPQSLPSRRPAVTNPVQPGSNSAQPTAVNSSQPMPASTTGPARPPRPISTNPAQPGLTNLVPSGSNSAQPTAVNSSQPMPVSTTGPARPPWPISTNPAQPGLTNLVPSGSNSSQPTAVNSSQPMPASTTGPARPPRPISTNPAQPGSTNLVPSGSNSAQPTAVNSSQPSAASSTSPSKPVQPISTNPARPDLTNFVPSGSNAAQPTAVNSSQPTPASLAGPARPAQPISTNPVRPGLSNPTWPSVPQSAASRPAPYKTSTCTSFHQKPVHTAVTKPGIPPKPQNQCLPQDFTHQPIPWRRPDILGPIMSKPITDEQRPEREAMKRKAQLERENAAKYTSLGKMQYFIEREKEMGISRYYGYAK